MTSTAEIAEHLAHAARLFPWLGPVQAGDLLELVRLELGHPEVLDRFVPYGAGVSKAVALSPLLHIVSGNTPHAALQSLLRGLLVGGHNWCKVPKGGLPEVETFCKALPEWLAQRVEIQESLPPEWVSSARVVTVFGSDQTVDAVAKRLRADQRLVAHGHRLSFGIVFEDPAFASVEAAACDASLFDQQGCLSPHLFYVPEVIAPVYAARLAEAMEAFARHTPPTPLAPEEAASVAAIREEYRFRSTIEKGCRLWASPAGVDWTVILDPSPAFRPSCLHRTIFVKPLPPLDHLPGVLKAIQPHLSSVGIFPSTPAYADKAACLGVSRITSLGRMQFPPLSWHHDGSPVLHPFVRWIDAEVG